MRRLFLSRVLVAAALGMFVVGFASAAGAMAGGQSANSSASATGVANRNGGTRTVATTTASTTATTWGPQPPSNADTNPGGANNGGNCGAYCSTRDGSPSGNGSGVGQATGKPCAGCVGRADNKNPPGQFPNGTDHNAGYECDTNHGIGQSNPAHTGRQAVTTTTSHPTTTSSSTTTSSTTTSSTTTSSTTTSSSVLAVTNTTSSAGSIGAPAQVLGETLTRPASTPAGTLPLTGANVLRNALLGLWLMLAGGLLLLGRHLGRRTVLAEVERPQP